MEYYPIRDDVLTEETTFLRKKDKTHYLGSKWRQVPPGFWGMSMQEMKLEYCTFDFATTDKTKSVLFHEGIIDFGKYSDLKLI